MDQLYNYAQVANNCSQYQPCGAMEGSMSNSSSEAGGSSCLSCSHFKKQHCQLDLYDKINANLSKYSSEL